MTLSSVGASSLNLLSPRSKRWSLGRTAKSVAERKLGASFDLMDGAVCSEKSYPQATGAYRRSARHAVNCTESGYPSI